MKMAEPHPAIHVDWNGTLIFGLALMVLALFTAIVCVVFPLKRRPPWAWAALGLFLLSMVVCVGSQITIVQRISYGDGTEDAPSSQ